jgi:hypothetical protein
MIGRKSAAIMMRRQTRWPSSFLQEYVSQFELWDLVVLDTQGVRPLPARPAQFLVELQARIDYAVIDRNIAQAPRFSSRPPPSLSVACRYIAERPLGNQRVCD